MHHGWKTMMAIAVAATMSAPIVQAEWSAFGSFEPDTPYDAGWGFPDPAGIGENKIYFNAFSTYEGISNPGLLNPNVGALHTQIEVTNDEYHYAMLGVWKDCNGDGYVGLAESAVREYPAAALTTTTVCPPVSGVATGPWPAGAHNYNGWVSEWVSIIRNPAQNIDRRTYHDPEARVWGDYHRPDEDPWFRSCTLRPFARGTLHDTGGFMNYIDCRQPILENFNRAVDVIGDPLGLRFADEDDAHSGTLGQFDLGGDESSDHAAVYTADCSQDAHRVGDEINETNPTIGALGPNAVHNQEYRDVEISLDSSPQDTTVPGQMNATLEERGTGAAANCDYSDDFGHDFYNMFETDFNGINPKNKTEADWNFNSSAVSRGAQPYAAATPLGWNGPAGAPSDHGKGFGTIWGSDSVWLSKLGPRSVKLDLANGGVSIAQAYWLTFYAHVGQATRDRGLALPSAASGTYGSWHCGGNDSGIHHGWNCDADVWYVNPDGTFPTGSTLVLLAKPGWSYELRDVDCYDGRIGDSGVGVEPTYYGPEPCVTP